MLCVEDLSVSYGAFKALDGVSFKVAKSGTLHGIIGPNGAGKSTLMDALTGRRLPTRGKVLLEGKEITRRSVVWRRRNGISRSFQRTSIFPGHTVREQIELAAWRMGAGDAGEIIEAMGLEPVASLHADTIAYGDQRRVDIALALVGRPRLMLLDEPAAGLSKRETMALFDHLQSLVQDRGVTALVVEHDVDAVFGFCSEVTALDLGKVITTDSPAAVRRDARVVSAYLGSAA
ncbi:ABC transporter ATP-binding protein [Cupriavidus numazuensis]|jgi:branched-chain amino acid transport system ATP-binding protein|uniref:Lipopolysaccharide export system ATP-binding protein LptB n=1 Tax=Cupriavidus numazuensis TaxID=221992 RepID=A0ABM8TLF8_9BURK|nr:ATP-binding cassette domain-containing protein [Cupriavidus numazuensis]CAG2153407.1 Lipopolysaccharide export system ATP-binding protein LptB [Cupriavidus numazuensis]